MTKFFTIGIRRITFLLVIGLLATSSIMAQEKGTIKGKLVDSKSGEELIGANIFIQELSTGSSTDAFGNFIIKNVPVGEHVLTVRFIGYNQKKITVNVLANKTTEVNISLVPSVVELDELVVTGVGSAVEKKKLTASIESLTPDEIEAAPVESVEQLLQGRVPGLISFNSSGMPGTSGRMSTRGIKSAVTSSTPVIYVDGVRVDNNDAFRLAIATGGAQSSALSDLVVGEIDKIEVIKGGAASTLYGSEAANGVIQIFTKKGVPGDPKWSFTVTSGYDVPETEFVTQNFVEDEVLQNGLYQAYNASVTGGSQYFTYNVNGRIHENKGLITNDKLNSKMYNLGTGMRVNLQENMNLEFSASYVKSIFNRIANNNNFTSPYGGFEDGTYGEHLGYTDAMRDSILNLMLAEEIKDDVDRFRLAVNFDYAPTKRWNNKFTFGLDYRKNEERDFVPKWAGDFNVSPDGYVERADREYSTITMSYAGSYELPKYGIMENKLNFGLQGFRVDDREEYAIGSEFAIPGTEDFDNASEIDAQESVRELFSYGFYITDMVGLWNKVFIDFGVRLDGNTTFGDEIGLQVYPKAGIAYNISEEDFYPEFAKNYIPTLKLRAAWGQTGNFPAPFTRDRTYGAQSFLGNSGFTFVNPGNDDLKPEKTSSIDVGFDMGLFGDRAFLTFNYFDQNTEDALFAVAQDPSSGFNTQQTNVGEISNKGIEVSLNAQLLQYEDFSLDLNASYATLENKVESLGGSTPFSLSSFTFLPRRVEEGYPIGVFRVNVPDGNGGFNEVLSGTPMPESTGSFGLTARIYKNLTIRGFAEFATGHQFINIKNVLQYFNGVPEAAELVPEGYNFTTASSVWMEDADWFKIREIAVSYRLPKLIFRGVTLSASVRNLAVFGVDSTNDPELNGYQPNGPATGGYTFIDISAPRQFRFSVQVDI